MKLLTLLVLAFSTLINPLDAIDYYPQCLNPNQNSFQLYVSKDLTEYGFPISLDWRTTNNPSNTIAVTRVKNQGDCGSSYAFAAVGVCEGANAIYQKNLIEFSEQQILDCSGPYGNQGCYTGQSEFAYQYVISEGLCKESEYPYIGVVDRCRSCNSIFYLHNYFSIPSGNETALMEELQKGPIVVSLQSNQNVFAYYSGGILDDDKCGTDIDHQALLVGYGTDEPTKKPYWIVKNSWGTSWGEAGYIRIVRNKNMCGIALAASRAY